MRNTPLLYLVSFFIFLSCNDNLEEVTPEPILKLDETIIVDNIIRSFHIQHPADHEGKPLVLVLHGHGGSSDQSLGMGVGKNPQRLWLDEAKENEFIVVIPNGELGPEDSRGWNDCREDAVGNPSTDDVKFFNELLDALEQEYNHNPSRVYVAGVSNGAMMAQRLAEEIPEKITAFASIVNSRSANSKCTESDQPISALFMNGTTDPLVPYEGGQISDDRGLVISTDETIQYWIERNQTSSTPVIENFEDLEADDNLSLIHI